MLKRCETEREMIVAPALSGEFRARPKLDELHVEGFDFGQEHTQRIRKG